MKQIYRVDKSGNLAQAISEITAPKLLLLMSNNEQFEQHVEELERHFQVFQALAVLEEATEDRQL